jgi:hypothetical protein
MLGSIRWKCWRLLSPLCLGRVWKNLCTCSFDLVSCGSVCGVCGVYAGLCLRIFLSFLVRRQATCLSARRPRGVSAGSPFTRITTNLEQNGSFSCRASQAEAVLPLQDHSIRC